MTEANSETACDWTVSGMDCGSCATKIKDAVARLPGVSGVEVGIVSERLRLTLDEAQTGRGKIEKTVRALGYEIAPRAAAAKKEFVLPRDDPAKEHGDDPQAAAPIKRDDSGHGSPGHVHDDPADRGKRWYQTGIVSEQAFCRRGVARPISLRMLRTLRTSSHRCRHRGSPPYMNTGIHDPWRSGRLERTSPARGTAE